jgi:hypothetical protein
MGKRSGTRKPKEIDEDYRGGSGFGFVGRALSARPVVGYELAGDLNNPMRMRADDLRAEVMKRLGILIDGCPITLEALVA